MDQSHSESDISLSPSQILDRLQVLRQIQILQRGKLQKHRLQYENSPEISSNITEIVSHFSNSTSYNTFRSLLNSSQETPIASPHSNTNNSFRKESLENVVEGVSVLNLSEESEFIANSVSPRSLASARQDYENENLQRNIITKSISKQHISLDEIPILSPKKDFETLLTEKLKNDKQITDVQAKPQIKKKVKKTFLRKGEGTARFGIKKNDLVIQNTKSLPWKKSSLMQKKSDNKNNNKSLQKKNVHIQINEPKDNKQKSSPQDTNKKLDNKTSSNLKQVQKNTEPTPSTSVNNSFSNMKLDSISINLPKGKHPLRSSKEKTWASVLTKEQDDFLRQLKQSEYYKNFASPCRSTVSDISCNENLSKLTHDREIAEQNLFELIENKVTHESFNIDSSFFNRFLKNSNLECSGESTPLVMQKCLYKNPNLMHILPDVASKTRKESLCSVSETCNSECLECNDNCSTVSSCCSCNVTTQENITQQNCSKNDNNEKGATEKGQISKPLKKDDKEKETCQNDTLTGDSQIMNSNMAEMNAKLIATSELLKDRLRELEDEIETFRKENANLTKMREEVDLERQKFYEEKGAFEQKFNEEKVLSEYYLAEEKEKLNKQKQIYERYVRDMRGRLNKKEKDEVINLKKEISDLKDEIKVKDAKSTSTIARLRNQLKIIEKDKKNLEDEIEKLKKENKRIQHSNDITRRLTNLKYLEEINKKLSNMTSRDSKSDVELDSNIKYKAYEIERQSRTRRKNPVPKGTIKQRAKSVPNLHVTSRYAKYFSQKDSLSNKENNITLNDDPGVEDNLSDSDAKSCNDNSFHSNHNSEDDEENNLERLYNERFKSISPKDRPPSQTFDYENSNRQFDNSENYFITKSDRNSSQNSGNRNSKAELYLNQQDLNSRSSKSPTPFSRLSNDSTNSSKENCDYTSNYYPVPSKRNKSPVSILSNRSSSSIKSGTVINKEISDRLVPSPEPTSSKTSLTKTKLNPTEIKMPDGTSELRFPNGNVKIMSADGKYSKFIYYNGDIKENFYNEGRIKYYYAETKTFHTTHPDGLDILEFPDGQVEKRYKDGSSEIRLPNGSIRYYDPKNEHVREEWRFPDGAALTVAANGEQRIVFANGQVEVHAKDHKRREFPDGSVKLLYNDGTAETRYASGRVRIKDKHGNLIMDSAPG